MNIEQAKSVDLETFIKGLGHQVVAGKGNQYEAWFLSPFRSERTPSFKVDRRSNKWKDFAEDYKQGDIIDFVQVYGQKQGWGSLSTAEALRKVAQLTAGSHVPAFRPYERVGGEEPLRKARYRIKKVDRIRSKKLVDYLRSRRIWAHVAKNYLKEIHYYDQVKDKPLYGLCWENDSQGYEIRSKFLKSCIGPKAISIITVQGPTREGVAIFEGMMDFLSYLQLTKGNPLAKAVVMNSRSLYQPTVDYCQLQQEVPLMGFLQNDKYGLETLVKLKRALPCLAIQNNKYIEYEDVNDFLVGKKMNTGQISQAEDLLCSLGA
jgi:hypothetical protein